MTDTEVMQEYIEKKNSLSKGALKLINQLCDPNSFVELNMFASGGEGTAICCGHGRIDDRVVFVYAFNHDINSGVLSDRDTQILLDVFAKAESTGTPIIGILHCDGLMLTKNLLGADGWGKLIKAATNLSGKVPHILYVKGTALGIVGMYTQCADVLLLDSEASLGIGTAQKYVISSNDCSSNGTAAILTDGNKAFDDIKRVLSYLPDNSCVAHDGLAVNDDINRKCDHLSIGCDAVQMVDSIFDIDSFVPLYGDFGKDIIAGFASVGGISVITIANNDTLISHDGSRKARRILQLANAYGLPVVVLCNTEGFKVCKECELNGILSSDAALAMEFSCLTVPLITVIVGKAIGSAYVAMGSKSVGADVVYAWVGSEIGLISAEAAVAIGEGDKVATSEDPIAFRKQLAQEYKKEKMNVFIAAQSGLVDQPILPQDTRVYIAAALDCMINKNICHTSNNAIKPI